jgi:phosphate transport system substrate-binding protein
MIPFRRAAATLLLSAVALSLVVAGAPQPAAAAPAKINGSGSTYVALAMQQWVADAQTRGLDVNYLPTGSPDGLTSFAGSLTDFAGTEAEFSALGAPPNRSFQYIPSVAGAVAVMYNVVDKAGRKVDYLRLSMRTVARIFMGDIARWCDPAITADNLGLELPCEPITVVYRSGQSGTTALFYDFVASVAPDVFGRWAAANRLPTDVRIIQLDGTPGFAPKTLALNGSDQMAQYTASDQGRWAIAYDEFGYAKVYNAMTARVQNAAGEWVLPYAENIAAALESASLRPDLSQELSGVYASTNPLAYPISAYSYIVTQCAPDGARPTCRGPYSNSGVAETLARWLRYIACDGQTNMARIGYSPLPTNLSQEVANSIARMTGAAQADQLNADNCANPTFRGSLGAGAKSPDDPLKGVASLAGGDGGAGGGDTGGGRTGGDTQAAAAAGSSAAGATGRTATASRASGATSTVRDDQPVAFSTTGAAEMGSAPLFALISAVCLPVAFAIGFGVGRGRRAGGAAAGTPVSASRSGGDAPTG